jgi:predicted RNA-binding protein with PUA-like domain
LLEGALLMVATKKATKDKTTRRRSSEQPERTAHHGDLAPSPRRDGMGYWLVKVEPHVYPWSKFVEDKSTVWDGVRNYTARKYLRAMKLGDRVLYYHSGEGKCVMGVATVTREAFDDPTAPGEGWSAVELAPLRALNKSVSLAEMKQSAALEGFLLFRQPRLSVLVVTPSQFDEILRIGHTSL